MTDGVAWAACAQVRAGLVPLLAELRANGSPPDDAWIAGKFDVDKQVGQQLLTRLCLLCWCRLVPTA